VELTFPDIYGGILEFHNRFGRMTAYKPATLALMLLLGASPGYSQEMEFVREVEPFQVFRYGGTPYKLPFLGGLNRPIQQILDIDADGDPDIFVRDSEGRLKFFENVGTPESPDFQWVTDGYQELEVGGWFRFVDGDGDGDQDLFADNPVSNIRYYRNIGTPSEPAYSPAVDSLRDDAGNTIFAEVPTIPAWSDVDCDGDADLFLGRLSGQISHYLHSGLDQDSIPVFTLATDSFQGLLIVTGGDDCFLAETSQSSPLAHGSNAMTFVDIDADLDSDLFWGDFFAQSLLYLENSGTCPSPAIALTLEQYPDGNPVCTGGFNIPSFSDTDNDGDLDLYVGTQGGAYSLTRDLADNLYHFENTGGPGQQQFALRSKRFLDGIDIGENSIPAVADIDGDSDLDLLVGNEAEPASDNNSRLHFFRNEGSALLPILTHADTNYLALEMGYNYAPTFVDIDADGDQDLVLGEWSGNLNLLRNDGTPTDPLFVLVDEDYAGIDIGNNSTPGFVDIDNDGDEDLFIGEFLGNLNFYRNNGTPQNALFELDTIDYFGIDAGTYSSPAFSDVDDDGDFDLFVGSDDQGILLYRNEGTPESATFVPDTVVSFPVHFRATPVLADIDGDMDVDLISGVEGGGMVFYRNQEIVSSAGSDSYESSIPQTLILARSYPNPFNPETQIVFELARDTHVSIQIVDLTGRIVSDLTNRDFRKGRNEVRWQAGEMASGIYFCKIRAGESLSTLKLLLMR